MSTSNKILAFAAILGWVALIAVLASKVRADGVSNPVTSNAVGYDGVNNSGVSGAPPVSCGTGAINLSTGCTQAMLGGL